MIKPLCPTADLQDIRKREDDVEWCHREEISKIQTMRNFPGKTFVYSRTTTETSKIYRREKEREKKTRGYWKISTHRLKGFLRCTNSMIDFLKSRFKKTKKYHEIEQNIWTFVGIWWHWIIANFWMCDIVL